MSEQHRESGLSTRRGLLKIAGGGALAVSGAGWLAACGGGSGASSGAGTSAATGTPAAGTPVKGGALRFGQLGAGPRETLNPIHYTGNVSIARQLQIFDPLVRMKPDLQGWVPALAEELEPNKDFSVWTVRLRQGVKWHDGKPLTADDLVWTLQQWLDPANDPYAFIGIYMDKHGIKKLDDRTVRFRFQKAFADPYGTLASPPCHIYQQGEKDFKKPAGTGAFKLTSFVPGVSSNMVRNEDYWDTPAHADTLEMLSIQDPTSLVNALLSGKIDIAAGLDYTQGKAQKNSPQIDLLVTQQAGGARIYMNMQNALFKDDRVRQAMRLIVDRQALIDNALLGFGNVCNDIDGVGLPYFPKNLPARERDLEKAKSLLKAAGQSDLRTTLHTAPLPGYVAIATLFAEQAKQAGVTLKVKTEQLINYYDPSKLAGHMEMAVDSDFPLPSIPANRPFVYSSNGRANPTNWRFPAFDKKLDAALAAAGDEGQARWDDVHSELYDRGPDIIWSMPNFIDAVSKKVKGIQPHKQLNVGNYNLKSAWIQG